MSVYPNEDDLSNDGHSAALCGVRRSCTDEKHGWRTRILCRSGWRSSNRKYWSQRTRGQTRWHDVAEEQEEHTSVEDDFTMIQYNVHSFMRFDESLERILIELDDQRWDVLVFSETWRGARSETWETESWHTWFGIGGEQGSKRSRLLIESTVSASHFQAYLKQSRGSGYQSWKADEDPRSWCLYATLTTARRIC